MLKRVYGICVLFAFSLLLFNCEKRPFATIEIKGRVLNYWDKSSAVPSQIQLWVGGARPGDKGTTNYGNYYTNADGSFDIKSNAQWEGTGYKLRIVPNADGGNNLVDASCSVPINKSIDIGDIFTGDFTFICNVKLNSVSGASISFLDIGTTVQTSFSAGTNTVVTASKVYSYDEYQIFGNSYHIGYRLSTSTADSSIFVPMHPPADTCSVTINY